MFSRVRLRVHGRKVAHSSRPAAQNLPHGTAGLDRESGAAANPGRADRSRGFHPGGASFRLGSSNSDRTVQFVPEAPLIRHATRRTRLDLLNKQSIQAAVIDILTEQGTSGLTMDNVAAAAGMAKGTLYASFENKDQLIEWVRNVTLDPLRAAMDELLTSERAPAEKLRELTLLTLRFFEANQGTYRVLLWERHHELVHRSRHHASPPYRALVARVADVLRAGVADGAFRPLNVDRVAALIVEANTTFVAERLFGPGPGPVEADADLLFDLLLHGISTSPGPAPKKPTRRVTAAPPARRKKS